MRGLVVAALLCALVVDAEPAVAEPASVVLGRYTTTYAKDDEHKSRAFNVELAADAIDGHVLAAGATFSFNDAVGERTAAFGYERSVVLRDGMIAEGTGGGACQVASTLYAAALLAGFEVIARAPHSRPSAYIRMGFDATVVYPRVDLKVKNGATSAVTVHARARHGTLDVWLDAKGATRPDVTLSSEIVERVPFERVVQRDRALGDASVHVRGFGIPGYRVRRIRTIRGGEGRAQRDVRFDTYLPVNELVALAPSVDEDAIDATTPRVVEPSAVRPALVQLRPSSLVEIDNAP